jgi:hypothetical protein
MTSRLGRAHRRIQLVAKTTQAPGGGPQAFIGASDTPQILEGIAE